MKKYISVLLVGSIILASGIFIISSHSQGQSNVYLGRNGWILKQNIILKLQGQEPKLMGRREIYFAADGRRKSIQYGIDSNGAEKRRSITICDPKQGFFAQNFIKRKLFYLGECAALDRDRGGKYLDAYDVRTNSNYVKDEQVAGYDCAMTRDVLENSSTIESYRAYRLGGFDIKQVNSSSQELEIWEPTSIEIVNVKDWEVAYPTDWEIDFSVVEDDIKDLSTHPDRAKYVETLRRELSAAKQRLIPAK